MTAPSFFNELRNAVALSYRLKTERPDPWQAVTCVGTFVPTLTSLPRFDMPEGEWYEKDQEGTSTPVCFPSTLFTRHS